MAVYPFGCSVAFTGRPLLALGLASALCLASPVHAESVAIPPGALDASLIRFGSVTGVMVVADARLTSAKRSAGASVGEDPAETLARLLEGTGLVAEGDPERGYRLVEVAQAQGERFDTLTVTGQSSDEWERVSGYTSNASRAATKTPTALVETPQSISVIGRAQLDAQGSNSISQALRYTPGVFSEQIGATDRYDYAVMRGFSDGSIDNVFLDGLKSMGDAGGYNSIQVDPFFLERIDVIKGPSSVLYGNSSPGGLVALTSKKPLLEPYRHVEFRFGTQGRKGTAFDFSAPLDRAGTLAYRLVGLAEQTDTQFDAVDAHKRFTLAPSLSWTPDENTFLNLQAYLQHEPGNSYHSGVPADGAVNAHNGKRISRQFFDGDPESDRFERDQTMLAYQFGHRLNDIWSVRQNFRYLHSKVDLRQVYGYGWVNGDSDLLNRYYSGGQESLDAYAIDNIVQADFATGPLEHTLLMGLDYQWRRNDVGWQGGTASPIDPFAPDYSQSADVEITSNTRYRRDLQQTGIYLQDQIELGGWRFSLGGRQDWVETEVADRDAGTAVSDEPSHFSGRAGVLYAFDNGLSPYLSYSESFSPSSAYDADGQLLEPTEGRQWETGLKYQRPGSDDLYSVALFHIEQENVAAKRPEENFYRAVGEIRSQGVELEANTALSERWRLLAAYAFTDVEYRRTLDGTEGNTPYQAPRHQASIWSDYRFDQGSLAGLQLGAGVRYIGGIWADAENTLELASYTLVDASVGYDFQRLGAPGLNLRLNLNNLFDRDYVSSCYSLDYCYFGAERSVVATLGYTF